MQRVRIFSLRLTKFGNVKCDEEVAPFADCFTVEDVAGLARFVGIVVAVLAKDTFDVTLVSRASWMRVNTIFFSPFNKESNLRSASRTNLTREAHRSKCHMVFEVPLW